jgi:hypothetical protein
MKKAGIPCIGVDPYPPLIPDSERDFDTPFDIIIRQKGQSSALIQRENALIIIARPCHDGFTEEVILGRNLKTEVLYIGLQKNVGMDLGNIKHEEVFLGFEIGNEQEKIYRIKPEK